MKKIIGRIRPTVEDLLRAVGYLTIIVWAILFAAFPATVFSETLDRNVLFIWMSISGGGAFIALVGSLTRLDLKVEYPGLWIALFGPLFYSACQLYFVLFPSVADDQINRGATVVFGLLPVVLLLPRLYALMRETHRMKRMNKVQRGVGN